ncbi:MAG TPA: hypothetical protein P5550_07270 [Bacteroidales bacterium]|nr:hypothetical protein [Bacteroidales bacterium]
MERNIYCTVCRSQLRIGEYLVLSLKNRWNDKGLVLLNAEPGNYSVTTHSSFTVKEGEDYTFYCPVCHTVLNDKEKPHLVKLFMEEDGRSTVIYFSSIAGEKVTIMVNDREVKELGPDQARYQRYFDLQEEYRKYLH